jgi:hypothetical protein
MSNQPEALRLADALADYTGCTLAQMDQAAAELRRLHASCEDYAQHKQRQDQRVLELAERALELKAQRKPLTEEEIFAIENDIPDDVLSDRAWTIWLTRAVEQAHGIGGTDE